MPRRQPPRRTPPPVPPRAVIVSASVFSVAAWAVVALVLWPVYRNPAFIVLATLSGTPSGYRHFAPSQVRRMSLSMGVSPPS